MPFDADQAITRELAPGERLLWSGRPRGGIQFRRGDALLIPFSLVWAGFAVFWEISAIRAGEGSFFVFWGIPFVLVGAYFVVGRFVVDAWQRGQTAYGLTDRRAIITTRSIFSGRVVKSLPLRTLGEISLSEKSDASGTITLGSSAGSRFPGWMSGAGWPGTGKDAPPSFDMIQHAHDVYEQLRRAQDVLFLS
jgi:hypothetical protein